MWVTAGYWSRWSSVDCGASEVSLNSLVGQLEKGSARLGAGRDGFSWYRDGFDLAGRLDNGDFRWVGVDLEVARVEWRKWLGGLRLVRMVIRVAMSSGEDDCRRRQVFFGSVVGRAWLERRLW
uniref:Uncharacterized protein n=1 Tax=Cannabis sativa TaxID=3483 RepID=A0A803PHG9_CANSA